MCALPCIVQLVTRAVSTPREHCKVFVEAMEWHEIERNVTYYLPTGPAHNLTTCMMSTRMAGLAHKCICFGGGKCRSTKRWCRPIHTEACHLGAWHDSRLGDRVDTYKHQWSLVCLASLCVCC